MIPNSIYSNKHAVNVYFRVTWNEVSLKKHFAGKTNEFSASSLAFKTGLNNQNATSAEWSVPKCYFK